MALVNPPPKIFAYTLPIEVCLRDLDALGHVNNAVYLTYLETARNRWVFTLGGRRRVEEFDFILARTTINFRTAASFHETLHVSLRPRRIGNASWELEYEVHEVTSGRLVADAESVQVSYNYQAQRSMPVPADFRRLLEAEMKRCGSAAETGGRA